MLLLFISLFSQVSPLAQNAILIGIDGFLTSCINSAPNLDFLKSKGSYTFKARATIEAVSAPGWSAIMCGQAPVDTGVLGNDWIPYWKSGKRNKITPLSGDGKFLCMFEQVKKSKPETTTRFYHNWDWLRFLGPDIGFVDDYSEFKDCNLETDTAITAKAVEAIKKGNFGFMFTYLGSLDEMGHESGFCDQQYIEHITKIDSLVGQIIRALNETNQFGNTMIVLTTDHGAEPHTKDHGKADDFNILVPFVITGPGVKENHEIQETVNIMDTAPTLLYGMGIGTDASWRGRPVLEAWSTAEASCK